MKTTTEDASRLTQVMPTLPAGYRQQAFLDLSQSKEAIAGAVAVGIVILVGGGWLLVQFVRLVRPAALEGLALRNILRASPGGGLSVELPLVEVVVAILLTVVIHELVHSLFYWWLAKRRPTFGIKGLFPYAAAPAGVYFPRNRYLMVGIAPFVLLTAMGLLLMLIAPAPALSILSLFIVFNAAGAAGDLLIVLRLLSFPAETLMQDQDTGVVVYGPAIGQSAA
jgi:hypothetical protein